MLVSRIRHGARGNTPNYEGVGEMLQPIGAPAIGPLIELLQHSDPDVQALAVMTLAQLGDLSAVEPLIATLESDSAPTRRASAEALAKLGGSRATGALVMALGDQDSEVRQISASLLTRSGPRVVEPLIGALSSDDPDFRREAARVLGSLRDSMSVEPLIDATRDPDEETRWAAANALIAIGDRRAIEALVRLLMHGDVVQPVYMHSLLGILRRALHAVPVEILLELVHLEYILGPPTGINVNQRFSKPLDNRVDCAEFRQIARQELARRGIQTER
jgi:HEAT repeat protein